MKRFFYVFVALAFVFASCQPNRRAESEQQCTKAKVETCSADKKDTDKCCKSKEKDADKCCKSKEKDSDCKDKKDEKVEE